MRWRWSLAVYSLVLSGSLAKATGMIDSPRAPANAKKVEATKFATDIVPFLSQYCTSCHSGSKPKAKLALDKYKGEADVLKDRPTWQKIAQRMRAGEMPPADNAQPTSAQIQ